MQHISEHDLERLYLGKVTSEEELARIGTHLFLCKQCVQLAEETQDFVDNVRVAILNFSDLERKTTTKKPTPTERCKVQSIRSA